MCNFEADDARVWSLGMISETLATSDCDRFPRNISEYRVIV